MSADKRALDDLDALFRAVPAEATASSSRPAKKVRVRSAADAAAASSRGNSSSSASSLSGGGAKRGRRCQGQTRGNPPAPVPRSETAGVDSKDSKEGPRETGEGLRDRRRDCEPQEPSELSMRSSFEQPATQNKRASAITADGSQQDQVMYARLPPALLPKGLRAALSTHQSGGSTPSSRHSSNSSSSSRTAAAASLDRFSDFVRGMVGGTRGHRETTAALASKLEGKVVYLDNFASGQTEAQSAGARAERQAGRATKLGLSGKRCKQMGLNALEARNGGSIPFRDLLGLHGVWKNYAARLVSKCPSQKVLQQRILSADLQGCYLTVSRASASSLVNVAGIVLREAANTFQLVTPAGKTLTIPKRSCAVRLAFADRVVTLDGGALMGRRGGGARQQQKAGKGRGAGAGGGPDDPAALPLPTAAL